MTRFTLDISEELNTWLASQAELNHRSKTKHIEHILEQAKKEAEKKYFTIGSVQVCTNGNHNFESQNPAMDDLCNCGMFALREVYR